MNVMKRLKTLSLTMALVVVVSFGAGLSVAPAGAKTEGAKKEKTYRIGFHFWKSGKIYDEAMLGIKDGLALAGIPYEAVVMQSNKDKDKAVENLRTMDTMGLDLIYSLSSAGTKLTKTAGVKTPVIATVINHPTSLGVGKDGNRAIQLTGTSYYVDTRKQLKFYLTLFPNVKKVGMLYDKNNPAGALAEEPFMQEACQELGKPFVSVGLESKDELVPAAKKLVKAGVDILVIPTNRLVYGNLRLIQAVTHQHKLPVLSMSKQGVENGALAGLYADTYKLGRYTAPMAKQILEGEKDAAHIPFNFIPNPDVALNLKAAKTLGYAFPADILGQATIIVY